LKPLLFLLIRVFALAAAGLAVSSISAAIARDPPAAYSRVSPSADGIGKIYMGREIAQVMSYHGASWLERNGREKEERPDLVLESLEIKAGMSVADVGAGSGYYSRRMAQIVGPAGTVYAVDIQPEMLKLLERDMARQGIVNVRPVLATATDPRLAPDSLDLAIMVDVYHELEYPQEVLSALVRALKPGGRLALVEFRAGDPRVPIKRLHTMSEEQVRKEAAAHPLEWVNTVRDLPWQHVIVFRKKS
jgi:FkbM family methyltransferase